jgi:hypothetical protein
MMMKKLTVLTAILVIALGGCGNPASGAGPVPTPPPEPPDLWDGETIAEDFAGGNGSKATPYIIRTGAQLAYLAWTVNARTSYEGKYFTLESDLDLDDHEWTAIGTYDHRFKGNFDGKDHVISGLRINKPAADYQGLFGYLDGADISNLGLKDVAITGKNYVGGIAGAVDSSGIENSYSTGTVSGTGATGGIAGFVGSGSIENSYSTGAVSGTSLIVGGIAGWVISSSIANSYSTGAVSGTSLIVGGIAGWVISSSIANSYSTGTVSGEQVGGIAGAVQNSSSITGSYSTGAVSGSKWIGGIAGIVSSNNSIENCTALNPSVTASTSNAGRIMGGC